MISANMSRTEIADAIKTLWQQADAVRYNLKKIVRSMDDDESGDDTYYAHANLLDQIDHIAGKLEDADIAADEALRPPRRG